MQGNFYVATQYGCAVLLNKDTFEPNFLCVPLLSLASSGMLYGLSRGMVVIGKFRRAPDKSCPYFTSANIHINNECAKRTSVCILLLLLIRDLCLRLVAVVVTGDFQQGCRTQAPPGLLRESAPHFPGRGSLLLGASSQLSGIRNCNFFFVNVRDPSICTGFPFCCRPSVRAPSVRPSSCRIDEPSILFHVCATCR